MPARWRDPLRQGPGGSRRIRELWLLFSQAVTLILAVLFVVGLVGPGNLFRDDGSLLGGIRGADDITFSRSLSRIMPSVVSVRTSADGDFGRSDFDYNIGSGVIVSPEGHILTNHHVISEGGTIQVITKEGNRLDAELVGSDLETDIAVLKVEPAEPLQPVRFKDRSRPVRVGDLVMSVGSPYGLPNTASLGIVSAVGRSALGVSRYEHFIQTDAAINYGSSGGALANVHGELVGINTALFSKRLDEDGFEGVRETGFHGSYAQGIGFAIPSELAEVAYGQIVEHGRFRRGWIGLGLENPDPLKDEHAGLDAWIVDRVEFGSPADSSGVEVGDLLVAIDGRAPSSISFLEEATGELLVPGEALELSLVRDGEPYTAYVMVKER